MSDIANQDQIEYWNGESGEKWVRYADQLDGMMTPFVDLILETAQLSPGETVMDIGCGSGALSRAACRAVGSSGQLVGVDVSRPMLKLARERAQTDGLSIVFHTADASLFETDRKFDVIISRFGVMFFDDPVSAFSNIRSHLKPGGRMAFACWRSVQDNGWAMTPLQVALPYLPESPMPAEPGSPGPFAFAEDRLIKSVLETAGWQEINIDPVDVDMVLPGQAIEESASFMLKMGPLAGLIREAGLDIDPIEAALIERFKSVAGPDGKVVLPGGVWIVSARAGDSSG